MMIGNLDCLMYQLRHLFEKSSAENLYQNFEKLNIKGIIRLNEPLYDQRVFNKAGISVHDLEFLDGSCPEDVFYG